MAVVSDTPRLFDPAPRRAPGASRTAVPPRPAAPTRSAPPIAPAPRPPAAVAANRERTLEELLASTWGGLRLTGSAACPLCGGELAARYGAGAGPVGGRCRSCGTELG